jgi:hypothetical protein
MPTIDEHAQATLVKARAPQIRPRLQDAVRLIVTEGLSQADAARRSGMTPHSLQVALKKPHVRAFMASVKDAWLESRTSKAWLNIAELADGACSEDVRLKANRTFLEAAGELGFKGKDAEGTARQLVQILVTGGHVSVQPTDNRLPGVVEAETFQLPSPQPSDSRPVRRAEIEDDDGE